MTEQSNLSLSEITKRMRKVTKAVKPLRDSLAHMRSMGAIDDAKANGIPFPPVVSESSDDQISPENAAPAPESNLPADPEDEYKFPYSTENDTRKNCLKALQCVAFLLEWSSRDGNENVDGFAANGLSILVRQCAKDVEKLYSWDDVYKAGGRPSTLPRNKEREVRVRE